MATLDEQYLQQVNEQRNYLQQLQEAFNRHCDGITAEAQKRLAAIAETDKAARAAVIEDQKKKLAEALANLKAEIEKTSNAVRRRLEEINRQREEFKLNEIEEMIKKEI